MGVPCSEPTAFKVKVLIKLNGVRLGAIICLIPDVDSTYKSFLQFKSPCIMVVYNSAYEPFNDLLTFVLLLWMSSLETNSKVVTVLFPSATLCTTRTTCNTLSSKFICSFFSFMDGVAITICRYSIPIRGPALFRPTVSNILMYPEIELESIPSKNIISFTETDKSTSIPSLVVKTSFLRSN